jgi:hypothetical protein
LVSGRGSGLIALRLFSVRVVGYPSIHTAWHVFVGFDCFWCVLVVGESSVGCVMGAVIAMLAGMVLTVLAGFVLFSGVWYTGGVVCYRDI